MGQTTARIRAANRAARKSHHRSTQFLHAAPETVTMNATDAKVRAQ